MNLEAHAQQHHLTHALPKANFVDLQQYLGDWYILARIPTPIETGAFNAVESYRWNDKAHCIDIDYHHNVGGPYGPLRHFPQKAWVADAITNSEWKVQILWPFRFTYQILEVAPDYTWSLVGTPSRNFVWILSRKTSLDEETYNSLIQKLDGWGYDISKLRKVPQVWDLA